MGCGRDCEIHRGYHHSLEYHRIRGQLVGIHGAWHACFLVSRLRHCIALYSLWVRYGQAYHGQMALQIGILVAFTQLIPEHQVQLMGVIKTRVKVCFAPLFTKLANTRLTPDVAYGLCHIFDCHVDRRAHV